jgi:hypothetical protein
VAIALVGSAGAVVTGTATTVHPAFGQATTAGNLLIAWVGGDGLGGFLFNDATWTAGTAAGSTPSSARFFWKANCGAGETAPSPSCVSGTIFVALAEFSGAATVAPHDQHGQAISAGTSPITATAAGADVGSGELIVSCGMWVLTKAGANNTTDTYNNGATPTTNLNNDATSLIDHYRFAWGTTTGNSIADADTQTNDSMNLSADGLVIETFQVAASTAQVFDAQQGSLRDDPFSLQAVGQAVKRGAYY